jgi:leucyl aminopeptidase
MTPTAQLSFIAPDALGPDALAGETARIVVLATEAGQTAPIARRLDRLTRGALARALASPAFARLKPAEALELAFPAGMATPAIQIVRLERIDRRTDAAAARRAGATIGARLGPEGALVLAGAIGSAADLALGAVLRAYDYADQRTAEARRPGALRLLMASKAAAEAAARVPVPAIAEGVFYTRDLVSAPANVLTTQAFADSLTELRAHGVEVEVLDPPELERLGMRLLLAVGQGSDSPSKVVVMQWKGASPDAPPLALVGKGVVFDTGGISIKPAAGMEDMTMDMGGAGVVAGTMRALARRGARANVVGLVGLVENMPSGNATRPGDVVKSMKGDTVEIINTDAEGRLVLADVLWYAQERFKPAGIVNLATLTGAIIIALGHENTGVFSNDDALCNALLAAAQAEGEGAWRMPLSEAYDRKLKSDIADFKNIGGREGGAITAAQFLQRFIKPGMPWVHLDIAGTALVKADTAVAPKGATGWGVRTLNRLVADRFEG